jgi:DnaD/phage-associated family protein
MQKFDEIKDRLKHAGQLGAERRYGQAVAHKKEPSKDKLAQIVKAYEAEIGLVTPNISERLKEIASTYPDGWFEKAVAEASKYNKRNLSYIEKILERWKAEGITSNKSKSTSGMKVIE